MRFPGWFVKITTDVGSLQLPFGSPKGYRTKNEAEFVASEALKCVPGIVNAEVVKYNK